MKKIINKTIYKVQVSENKKNWRSYSYNFQTKKEAISAINYLNLSVFTKDLFKRVVIVSF
jgi:hypothetical protein